MRFLLVLGIWIVTAAVVLMFFVVREKNEYTSPEKHLAEKQISIEITSTFSAEDDPYALKVDEETSKSFSVFLDGKIIYETDTGIEKGVPLVIDAVKLNEGSHEIMVRASAPMDSGENAVRIKAFADGNLISENTEWFEEGQDVAAVLRFSTGNRDAE